MNGNPEGAFRLLRQANQLAYQQRRGGEEGRGTRSCSTTSPQRTTGTPKYKNMPNARADVAEKNFRLLRPAISYAPSFDGREPRLGVAMPLSPGSLLGNAARLFLQGSRRPGSETRARATALPRCTPRPHRGSAPARASPGPRSSRRDARGRRAPPGRGDHPRGRSPAAPAGAAPGDR